MSTEKEWLEQRRNARVIAMKLMYLIDFPQSDADATYQWLTDREDTETGGCAMDDHDRSYVQNMLELLKTHGPEVDTQIKTHAKGWTFERIAKVDRAILRLAIVEMRYMDDIPAAVSMNEAVEIAKAYSGEKAGSFVNGVLASVKKEMESV
jgi:N utilization substance protein B